MTHVGLVFKMVRNPHARAYRLFTVATHLIPYLAFYSKLKRSTYGKIIPKDNPFYKRRFTTPYLATFLSAQDRLTIQNNLCDMLDAAFNAAAFTSRLGEGVTLWTLTTETASAEIVVKLASRTVLEGDLLLEYRRDDLVLHRLTFSFSPGRVLGFDDDQVVFIGGSQGLAGTSQHIRAAAKDNGEINPANMLVLALRGLCDALGIAKICGVSSKYQVVVYPNPDEHTASYDDLWRHNSGEARDRYYVMAADPYADADKPVLSGNKSRTRRKRRLKQQQIQQISAALRPLLA